MFFKNELKKRIKNEKGLTLIELLAVIVILAIIAAIAIPAIGNIIANSRAKAVVSDAQNALSAANIYFTDDATATSFENNTTATPDYKSYLESEGKITAIKVSKGTPNKIDFTAVLKSDTYKFSAVSLDDLTSFKVKEGLIYKSDGTTLAGTKQ